LRYALAQRVLQIDRDAVLLEDVGERFVRQLLDSRHSLATRLLQLVESVVVEGDQFAHGPSCSCIARYQLNRCECGLFRLGVPGVTGSAGLAAGGISAIGPSISRPALVRIRTKAALFPAVAPERTRPSAQYDANGLASPGY
jgi:hypothetical protein